MKIYIITLLMLFGTVVGAAAVNAQTADDYAAANRYYRGRVIELLAQTSGDDPFLPAAQQYSQRVKTELITGPRAGAIIEADYFPGSTDEQMQNLKTGETVVIVETEQAGQTAYYVTDRYRLPAVGWLAAAFFALVVIFTGWRGARSLLGLGFSLVVIIYYIVPNIISGQSPLLTFLLGALAIAVVSLYLGHGFNRRTSIAVAGTLLTLGLAVGLASAAIHWTALFGLGSEEAFYVQSGVLSGINLRGLLLGGLIIGVLGLLDDITTAQAAVVEQLYRTDPALRFRELARRALSVGHEHIIALVNTLALAYAGASFPMLLLFTQGYNPLWTVVNSERITEEIVRTLIGSSALVLAVPITTYLAAACYRRYGVKNKTASPQPHQH